MVDNLKNKNIFVDYESIIRDLLHDLLIHEGYQVTKAEFGEPRTTASQPWPRGTPSDIYHSSTGLHLWLPVVRGEEAIQKLKESPHHIAFVDMKMSGINDLQNF